MSNSVVKLRWPWTFFLQRRAAACSAFIIMSQRAYLGANVFSKTEANFGSRSTCIRYRKQIDLNFYRYPLDIRQFVSAIHWAILPKHMPHFFEIAAHNHRLTVSLCYYSTLITPDWSIRVAEQLLHKNCPYKRTFRPNTTRHLLFFATCTSTYYT